MPGPAVSWKRLAIVDTLFVVAIWILCLANIYTVRRSGDTVWTGHRLWVGSAMEKSLDGRWKGTATIEPKDAPLAIIEVDDREFDPAKSKIRARSLAGYVPAVWLRVTDEIESEPEGKPIAVTVGLSVSAPTEGIGNTFNVARRSHTYPIEITPKKAGPLHRLLIALDRAFWFAFVGVAALFAALAYCTREQRASLELTPSAIRLVQTWLVSLGVISAALLMWKVLKSEVDRRVIMLVFDGVGGFVGGAIIICLMPGVPWFMRISALGLRPGLEAEGDRG